jgi:hypothetical protein
VTSFFLSYARADEEFALRLATDLRFAGGAIWVDQFDIQPSERWDRAVEAAVREMKGLLLILSPRSMASENVLDEVSVAIDAKKQIIPVMYEKCVLPLRLSRVQFIDATRDYNDAYERCRAAVLGQPWAGQSASAEPGGVAMSEKSAFDLSEWSPPLPPAPEPVATFDPAFLEQVAKLLTFHLGPLAKHIVSRDQRGATDRDDLYQRLCERVPAGRERAELRRKLQTL